MHYYYRYFYHLLAPVIQNVARSVLYISAGLLLLLYFEYENIYFNCFKKEKKEKKAQKKRESVLTLNTVDLVFMPHILLNCTKREITILK